ncbi:Xylulose kinase [Halotydeus destructor]|nr:Xylulose kinase [Halotydeus destructor]
MDIPNNSDQCSKLYLGFDLSTQQLKGVAVNDQLEIMYEASVHFDSDLPEFRTQGGVQRHDDKRTVTAPTLMWVKALDLVLEKLKLTGLDFNSVVSISGSGQQHGSVYWRRGASSALANLRSDKFMHQQLDGQFASRDSPIWMDSSSSDQCRALELAVGGAEQLALITGSRGYERFTGNQIMRMFLKRPEVYQSTERISLVSSFLASLFLGHYAAIDISDGSGMNLLDIRTRDWNQDCLDACGPELRGKLGEAVPSWTVQGKVSNYFVERYNFSEHCALVTFTGDNPASLIGMGLRSGDIAVSLGTSDTVFLSISDPKPDLSGHVLCNPIDESIFMGLICFKNGSRTRERIRDECAEEEWTLFNELLESTPRGNFGNIGFYFDFEEIFPVVSGDFRFNKFNGKVDRFSKEVEVRACIEGQFLRLRAHAENLGYKVGPTSRVLATGGASVNKAILQVLSDVFNCQVFTQDKANSAALGAAFMAKYGLVREETSFQEMTSGVSGYTLVASPAKDADAIYSLMVERYKDLESVIGKSKP